MRSECGQHKATEELALNALTTDSDETDGGNRHGLLYSLYRAACNCPTRPPHALPGSQGWLRLPSCLFGWLTVGSAVFIHKMITGGRAGGGGKRVLKEKTQFQYKAHRG